MRNVFKRTWAALRRAWSRVAKAVGRYLDEYALRRVRDMKGYKVVACPQEPSVSVVTVKVDRQDRQDCKDDMDDWAVVQGSVP